VSLLVHEERDPADFAGLQLRTDNCIRAGQQIVALPANCPVSKYRGGYEKVIYDVLSGSLARMRANNGALVYDDVRTQLKRIGDWYSVHRGFYPPSSGDAANQYVWGQVSHVLGNFWRAVHNKIGVTAPDSSFSTGTALDKLFANQLEADRAVLLAALTAPAPLTGSPLIELIGDAMQPVSARLAQVSLYHDLACRFRDNPSPDFDSARYREEGDIPVGSTG
jgi:hypothetical protein